MRTAEHPRLIARRESRRRKRQVIIASTAATIAGILGISSLIGALIWIASGAAFSEDELTQQESSQILDQEGDRDGVGEVSIENKYGVVIPESDARWDCRTMGNTECGGR